LPPRRSKNSGGGGEGLNEWSAYIISKHLVVNMEMKEEEVIF
jgi:hypothetical protein